ncbi:MAG: rhodanese-like domain-containing protein [Gammaproteobacteria bacterium]|nr:rhodanese-like domain-containing protein [Gammaproteobacteria bacterium]
MRVNIKGLGLLCGVCALLVMSPLQAMDVNITKTISYVETVHNGKKIKIQRIQDQENHLGGGYTKTSRKCPPFCVQPLKVDRRVETVGELEVLEFIREKLNRGTGILIDARTESWYQKGTIPGSINIPFKTFTDASSDEVKGAALVKLGVKMLDGAQESSLMDYFSGLFGDYSEVKGNLDFRDAKEIMLWCNGIWCGQSPAAIHGLLKIGYPPEKMYYYRGGMQAWQSLGLTVVQ